MYHFNYCYDYFQYMHAFRHGFTKNNRIKFVIFARSSHYLALLRDTSRNLMKIGSIFKLPTIKLTVYITFHFPCWTTSTTKHCEIKPSIYSIYCHIFVSVMSNNLMFGHITQYSNIVFLCLFRVASILDFLAIVLAQV